MTDSDRIRTFRSDVSAPSPEARAEARAALTGSFDTPRRHAAPRRLGFALAAGVALAVGVFAIASVVGDEAGVLERAEAAIDPRGRILHVVVRIEQDGGTVARGESWVRPDGTGRSLDLAGGGPGDCLGLETALRCYDPERNVVNVYRYNPEAVEAGRRYADLPGFRVDRPQSIHRAFAEGYARLVGETRIAGRAVYEIRLAVPFIDAEGVATPQFDDATSPVLYLDRETYHPVAQRFPDAGSTTYYETYEFLPRSSATERLLELPTNAETRVVVHPLGEPPPQG